MARDLKPLRRDLAVNVQGEMVYRALAAHPFLNPELVAGRDLRDDLLDRIVMTVFLEGRPPLRSSAAFDARIATQRGGIGLPAQEISRAVQICAWNGSAGFRRHCRRHPRRPPPISARSSHGWRRPVSC